MLDIKEIKSDLKLYRHSKNVLLEFNIPYNDDNDCFKLTVHIEKTFTDKMVDVILNQVKKILSGYNNLSMKITFVD